ncbi:MAG: hypothetical protein WBG92_25335 [Thiohalocapsa sp.]
MAYRDVTRIRCHEVKLRLSEREFALLDAYADLSGGQLATLVRELALQQARQVLQAESERTRSGVEGPR